MLKGYYWRPIAYIDNVIMIVADLLDSVSVSPSITEALSKLALEPLHMLELSLDEGGEGKGFPESADTCLCVVVGWVCAGKAVETTVSGGVG